MSTLPLLRVFLLISSVCVAAGRAQLTSTRSAQVDKAPSPGAALHRPCQQQAASLGVTFGADHVHLDPPFVVAGDLPLERLKAWQRGMVRHAADAMWRDYFAKRPTQPITILLFDSGTSYRTYAKRDYPDAKASHDSPSTVPYYGYYLPRSRTLVMNISTGGGTLIHELTHALMACDFPDAPDWLSEGLASLHEQCNGQAWSQKRLVGDVNWRLPDLKRAIAGKELRPLRALITADDFRGSLETLNYAQARYFCMYMQNQGALKRFYKAFRDGYRDDRTGLSCVEEAMGRRRIELIEQDFLTWVEQLRYP